MEPTDAVIAKRTDTRPVDTDEIVALAEAAGYEVVAELTQTRPPDASYQFGRGKAEELARTVADRDAGAVVFDNELTPTQTVELADLCPDGTRVFDRYRLVLDVFERGVGTTRAALQVERAKLKWELPRLREDGDVQALNRLTESGTPYYDVLDRIDELDRKLAELGDEASQRRERRREEGFEFVALAGYTNAGKSTLLHRLADDLEFEARHADHADLDATAEIEDRLFKTLETTTRRATIAGHRTLVTDTVGFLEGLSHDSVASFHDTLSATGDADCVVLVADAADRSDRLREKLRTSYDLLDPGSDVLTALNKVDLLAGDELRERRRVAVETAAEAGFDDDPVAISAVEGRGLDALRGRIDDVLPDLREAELALPNDEAAMSLVSWLYDRASVEDVTYGEETVRVSFAGRPSIVERARAKAESLAPER